MLLAWYRCLPVPGNATKQHLIFKETDPMDYSKMTNPAVSAALQAWQDNDRESFVAHFTAIPLLTDDGNLRSFQLFVEESCGKEKYITIDKVDNDGKDIYGDFQTEHWGTFKAFFKFHQNAEGKFDRLDIGQVSY